MRTIYRAKQAGFTLMELMVVIGIIAILAAIAVPNFMEGASKASITAATQSARTMQSNIMLYILDNNGKTPSDLDELISSRGMSEKDKFDPWNNEFQFSVEGNKIAVWSWGPDGEDGTEDDIIVGQ